MAFWKKSDDPWDRKPGKQTTNRHENETPAEEDSVGAATGRPPNLPTFTGRFHDPADPAGSSAPSLGSPYGGAGKNRFTRTGF